jgi:hypothetical protein
LKDRLRKVLGLSRMSFHGVNHPIAITDLPLEDEMHTEGGSNVVMDNFSFMASHRRGQLPCEITMQHALVVDDVEDLAENRESGPGTQHSIGGGSGTEARRTGRATDRHHGVGSPNH